MSETRYVEHRDFGGFRSATQALISAAQQYLEEVETRAVATPTTAFPREARRALIDALRHYDEAYEEIEGQHLLDVSDTIGADTKDLPYSPEETATKTGGYITILSRLDYFVEDFADLVTEGRRSYLSLQPGATEEEVDSAVEDLEDAIYEVLHENDDQVPFPFPAAAPVSGVTWFMHIDEAMSSDIHIHPVRPFRVADDVDIRSIFAHRYIFMPPKPDSDAC